MSACKLLLASAHIMGSWLPQNITAEFLGCAYGKMKSPKMQLAGHEDKAKANAAIGQLSVQEDTMHTNDALVIVYYIFSSVT